MRCRAGAQDLESGRDGGHRPEASVGKTFNGRRRQIATSAKRSSREQGCVVESMSGKDVSTISSHHCSWRLQGSQGCRCREHSVTPEAPLLSTWR